MSKNALYLIDGLPGANPENSLNLSDIRSMEVLKDASAQGPADAVTNPSFRAMSIENEKNDLATAQYDVFLAPGPG